MGVPFDRVYRCVCVPRGVPGGATGERAAAPPGRIGQQTTPGGGTPGGVTPTTVVVVASAVIGKWEGELLSEEDAAKRRTALGPDA